MSSSIQRLGLLILLIGVFGILPAFAQPRFELPEDGDYGLRAFEPLTSCPADSVMLEPGDDVAALVAAATSSAVYCFTEGVYEGISIIPNSGDRYIGLEGAMLDGGGNTASAFRSLLAPNGPEPITDVTIEGLIIQNYADAPTYRDELTPRAAVESSQGWTIENNVIQDNVLGIGLGHANWGWGDGSAIRNNRILNNSYMGIESNGSNIIFEFNELAGNGWNLTEEERIWSGGGSKFTDQLVFADDSFNFDTMIDRERDEDDQLVVRNNWVHSNLGHGIWLDINNRNALIEFNVFEYNYGSGMFDELSNGTTIRNNVFRGNRQGNQTVGHWGGAEILIANSQRGRVYENDVTVDGTSRAVVMIFELERAEYPFREYLVSENVFRFSIVPQYVNVDLVDVVTGGEMLGGTLGGWGEGDFYNQGNRFEQNTYIVPESGLDYFYWGSRMPWDAFVGAGMEAGGNCEVADTGADC